MSVNILWMQKILSQILIKETVREWGGYADLCILFIRQILLQLNTTISQVESDRVISWTTDHPTLMHFQSTLEPKCWYATLILPD